MHEHIAGTTTEFTHTKSKCPTHHLVDRFQYKITLVMGILMMSNAIDCSSATTVYMHTLLLLFIGKEKHHPHHKIRKVLYIECDFYELI